MYIFDIFCSINAGVFHFGAANISGIFNLKLTSLLLVFLKSD